MHHYYITLQKRPARMWAWLHRMTALLTTVVFLVAQFTFPPAANASHLGSSTQSSGSAPPPAATAIQSFQPDLFTGRATTNIPIGVPPGRKGVQPSLALAYASSSRNGWTGVGWGLDLAYIERSTKNGVPTYTGSDTYTFMFQGVSSELVALPDGTLRAKDEGLFLKFVYTNSTGDWEVRDKSGTCYFFGQTSASRIANGSEIFRWNLDKVRDPLGNFLTIAYTQDQNQLYPSQIAYTGHETGGSQTLAPTNTVDFILESRTDIETSYRSGFAITTAKRLKEVRTYATVSATGGPAASGSGTLEPARKYVLNYTLSQRTQRSLLTGVQQFGTDGITSFPATTFTYQDTSAPTYTTLNNSGNSGSQIAWNVQVVNQDAGHNNIYPCHPFFQVFPSLAPGNFAVVSGSANVGGLPVTVGSYGPGSITINGGQDYWVRAWTYVNVGSNTSLSLSQWGSWDAGCLYVQNSSGLSGPVNLNSVSLSAGWNGLWLMGYNQNQGFDLGLASPIASMVAAMSPSTFIKPQLAGDVDGNGITDLITFQATADPFNANAQNGTWTVSCAQSCTLGVGGTWLTNFGSINSIPVLGDWNGDGKTDIGKVDSGGAWTFATSNTTTMSFQTGAVGGISLGSGIPLTGDFNGDGLTDIGKYENGTWAIALALATGTGFTSTSSFGSINTWGGSSSEPITGDWNGDGLTDIGLVDSNNGTTTVRLSTGTSFTSTPETLISSFGGGQPHTSADFNGDGLSDVAYFHSNGSVVYSPSTGAVTGPIGGPQVTLSLGFGPPTNQEQLQVGDFNGDGLADPAEFNAINNISHVAISNGAAPDLLRGIANGLGGTTTLTYQRSTALTNTHLPFVTPVVQRVDVSDGMGQMGHTYTTTYAYEGGVYDAASKEFRGFAKATVYSPEIDPNVADRTIATTAFHQGAHDKGRPDWTEVRDEYDRLWTKTDQTWSCDHPYPGAHFVKLDATDSYTYTHPANGTPTVKHTRTRVTSYDAYGNPLEAIEDGEVGVSGDERRAITTYVLNEPAWILNKPRLVQSVDAANVVVAQRRFYYDGDPAPEPTALPTTGLLTKEEEWLVEDPLNPVNPQWLATTLTYDSYGNVATVTDALSRTTTNAYDAATHTYLATITNTLNHSRNLAYDPRTGQVLTSTDQNAIITTTTYDALGRVSKTIGPNDTSALPTIRYIYDPCLLSGSCASPIKTTACARIQSNQTPELCTDSYADGLGRTIQTRSPAENPTQQIVSGPVELNARGQVIKQWVPYLSNASASYVPLSLEPNASSLAFVSYTYDAPGRTLTVTEPDASVSSTSYDDWRVTVTDANGHQTRRTSDSHGQLAQVEEFNGGQTYTTTYAYDSRNNLTTVTDAASHVSTMTYDSLSRKRSMVDPDMGNWTYAYDAVDNLQSQTDARGVGTSFQYDVLNRLSQKSYAVPAASGISSPGLVTYTYDDAVAQTQVFAKGKLTDVTESAGGSGASRFEYDNLGRLTREVKTLDGTAYVIERAYDLLGRLTTLSYPDGDLVGYTYNNQGGIETITLQPTGGGASVPIVSDVDYNAAGQITRIDYGNGTFTDYAYDLLTLRLQDLTSTGPTGQLQHFNYQFDSVGNVDQITDYVHTATQTFGYDDLNRLTSATGSYGAFAYAYDPLGNMLEKEGVQMFYGQTGAPPHAVTSTISASPAEPSYTMSYDANGNMIAKTPQGPNGSLAAQLLTYDTENRLIHADTPQERTVEVTFHQGWNFFSLPVIPDDPHIGAIFDAASVSFSDNFEQLAKYDAATQTFTHFVGDALFDDFDTLEYGKGYQMYYKGTTPLTVPIAGRTPTQSPSPSLSPIWQLLPSMNTLPSTHSVGAVLGGLSYNRVFGYDAPNQQLVELTTNVTVAAAVGESYYVELTSASTWSPPLPEDVTTQFVYDGDGGRVKQITPSGITRFLGESVEIDPAGVVIKYLFAGSQRIASVKPGPPGPGAAQDRPQRWYAKAWEALAEFFGGGIAEASTLPLIHYYLTDHLGSSNLITNGAGELVQHLEYSPFGAATTNTTTPGTAPVAHTFTGQRADHTTGLILFPARAYDPQLGRFLQPDPFVQDPSDPQTLNRYSYVRNNPLKYVDPNGYGWFSWLTGFIGAIIGAVIGFFICGPDCAASGAVIGFNLGYNAGSWLESQFSGSSPPPNITFPSLGLPGAAGPTEGPSGLPQAPLPGQPPTRAPLTPPWLRPLARLAVKLAQELANWDDRTASVVEAGTMPVQVYSRPLDDPHFIKIGAPRHDFLVYNSGQNLVELENIGGKIKIKHFTGDRVQKYLAKWEGHLQGPFTVSVNKALFEVNVAKLDALNGQPYNWLFNNSNYVVHSLLYSSGANFPSGLGFAPGFQIPNPLQDWFPFLPEEN